MSDTYAQLQNIGSLNPFGTTYGAIANGNDIWSLEGTNSSNQLTLYKYNGVVWNSVYTLPSNIYGMYATQNCVLCFYNNELYFSAMERKLTNNGTDTLIATIFKYNGSGLTVIARLIHDFQSSGRVPAYLTDMKVFNNELYINVQGLVALDPKWCRSQTAQIVLNSTTGASFKYNGTNWIKTNFVGYNSLLNSKNSLKTISTHITSSSETSMPTSEFSAFSAMTQGFYGHPDSASYYSFGVVANLPDKIFYCKPGELAQIVLDLPSSAVHQPIQFAYGDSVVHMLIMNQYIPGQQNAKLITLKEKQAYIFELPANLQFNSGQTAETRYLQPVILSLRNTNQITFKATDKNTGLSEYYIFNSEDYKQVSNTIIPVLHGRVFVDQNTNNIFDAGDVPMSNIGVTANNIPNFTQSMGKYIYIYQNLISNSATISSQSFPNKTLVKPSLGSYEHPISSDSINMRRDFVFTYNTAYNDLEVNMVSSRGNRVRSALEILYYAVVKNNSGTAKSGTVNITNNSIFKNFNSTETTYNYSGGVVSFNFTNLQPDAVQVFQFKATLDNSIALNTTVNFTATIDPSSLAGDAISTNNQAVLNLLVVNSYDPNNKISDKDGQVLPGLSSIKYHINFQNTGNDTAYNVVVLDTLSSDLDLKSISIVAHSHPMNLRVNGRILKFEFYNINLVDSITNEPKSHGFITFRINAKSNLPVGTSIKNRVAIYFDFNPPIFTNYSEINIVNNLKTNKPSANTITNLFPNPNSGVFTFDSPKPQNYEITDLNGRIIQTGEFNIGDNKVNFAFAKRGFYFLRTELGCIKFMLIK